MNPSNKTWLRWTVVVLVLAVVVVAAEFLGRRGASGTETASASTRPAVPAGTGVVTGVVKFVGPPHPVQLLGEGECCPGAPPAPDESVVVNPNGTLANVVVYVKDGPNVLLLAPPTPTLDQKFCRYRPHVIAVHTDQPINVVSSDPVVHNINVQATTNPPENFSETTPGAAHTLSFAYPEFIHVKCDVHPWMSATIAVFDHPFFAVTGSDGSFRIDHLPPGHYTLATWQEKFGELDQPLTIPAPATQPAASSTAGNAAAPTQVAPVTFEYKP